VFEAHHEGRQLILANPSVKVGCKTHLRLQRIRFGGVVAKISMGICSRQLLHPGQPLSQGGSQADIWSCLRYCLRVVIAGS
jgi:hypothetical protein